MHDHDEDVDKPEGQPSGRTQQQYTLTAPIELRVHKLERTRDDIIEKVKSYWLLLSWQALKMEVRSRSTTLQGLPLQPVAANNGANGSCIVLTD